MKNHIIIGLQKAKMSHLSQLNYIQLLVKGVEIDETAIDKYPADCLLGIWLNNEGEKLKPYCGSVIIDEIRALLVSWYEEYRKIYDIYFTKKAGFLARFLEKDVVVSPMERDRAMVYIQDLETISDRMLKKIDTVNRKIAALGITEV